MKVNNRNKTARLERKTSKLACGAALVLILAVTAVPATVGGEAVSRYFMSGNGRIHLVSAKTDAAFKGVYRLPDGSYDQAAVKAIQQVFGAQYGESISTISMRLIEFLDYLEDRLQPGAKITIVSGWRSPQYNTSLREKGRLAAKASLHQYGMAADVKIDGVSSDLVWNYVKTIKFGGVGYYHGELVHVDVGPARSWDETTSGVGTDISDHNKLIGLVTDYDIYRPGDPMTLRFIRMTAFPIGVRPTLRLEPADAGGGLGQPLVFTPSFAVKGDGQCPQFADIAEMMGIKYALPKDLPPGRYRIKADFCQRLWDDMPTAVATPEFEIVRR